MRNAPVSRAPLTLMISEMSRQNGRSVTNRKKRRLEEDPAHAKKENLGYVTRQTLRRRCKKHVTGYTYTVTMLNINGTHAEAKQQNCVQCNDTHICIMFLQMIVSRRHSFHDKV
jgi:hypothetical protein